MTIYEFIPRDSLEMVPLVQMLGNRLFYPKHNYVTHAVGNIVRDALNMTIPGVYQAAAKETSSAANVPNPWLVHKRNTNKSMKLPFILNKPMDNVLINWIIESRADRCMVNTFSILSKETPTEDRDPEYEWSPAQAADFKGKSSDFFLDQISQRKSEVNLENVFESITSRTIESERFKACVKSLKNEMKCFGKAGDHCPSKSQVMGSNTSFLRQAQNIYIVGAEKELSQEATEAKEYRHALDLLRCGEDKYVRYMQGYVDSLDSFNKKCLTKKDIIEHFPCLNGYSLCYVHNSFVSLLLCSDFLQS